MTALNALFTAADGTALASYTADSGHSFVLMSDLSGFTSTIQGEAVFGNGYSLYKTSVNTDATDCAAEMSFVYLSSASSPSVGVGVRLLSPGGYNTQTGYILVHSAGSWGLYKLQSAALVSIGATVSQALVAGAHYKAKLQVIGSTLTWWTDNGDGVYVLRQVVTDSSFSAAGAIGFYNNNVAHDFSTSYYIDRLSEVPLVSGTATTVTLGGPLSGINGAASNNFTVSTNAPVSGTVVVTPSDGGGGGTFSPTTISLNSSNRSGTFTYTPASTGAKTLSVINDGGLSNPTSRTYTSASSGATAMTLTGPSTGPIGAYSGLFTVGTNGPITGTIRVSLTDDYYGAGTYVPPFIDLTNALPTATFAVKLVNDYTLHIYATNDAGLGAPVAPMYDAQPAATALTLSGPTSGASGTPSTNFTVGANGALGSNVIVTPASASGTFNPSTVELTGIAPTATFTYTPSGPGTTSVSITNGSGLGNPSSISYTASSAATAVTFTGPTSGDVNSASTNFTVGANGTITGTVVVTPSSGGGGGTFSPTSVSISSGAPTATFTYTPTSIGAKTLSVTNNGGLSNPANITYTSNAVPASSVLFTGPTSGVSGVASTNFTVSANGTITGTIVVTPSAGGGGGTFTPTTVSISDGTPTATFTYTPSSSGTKTISITNNGGLSNSSNISYAVTAVATAVTMTGPSSGIVSTPSSSFTVGANGALVSTVTVTPTAVDGTFNPTSVSISSGTPTATFTYTPISLGVKTLSATNDGGLSNPANLTYTAAGSLGTLAFLGPDSCVNAAASRAFVVEFTGAIGGTLVVTPSDSGGGGTFTPTTVSLTTSTPVATFTYTANSTGAKTLSIANDGGITNPASLSVSVGSSSSLVAGNATITGVTTSSASFTCAAATSGTGGYTYQWYRSKKGGYAPGAHSIIPGATSLTLTDSTGLLPDTPYHYVCVAKDSGGMVAYSAIESIVLVNPPLSIGLIGDSITYGVYLNAGEAPHEVIGEILRREYKDRQIVVSNQGVSGSTTADWQPGHVWGLLAGALAAFTTNNVTHVHIMLGTNDVNSLDAATYKTNMSVLANALVTAGYKVIISYPIYRRDGITGYPANPTTLQRLADYQPMIDSLVDNVSIFRGDTTGYNYFIKNHVAENLADMLHPNATGAHTLAQLWSAAIARVVYKNKPPFTTRTVTCSFVSRAGAPQSNLTGLRWQWSDHQGDVLDSGTGTTNGSGVFTITVHSALPVGGIGYLEVNNAAGVINTTYLSFSGPVEVS